MIVLPLLIVTPIMLLICLNSVRNLTVHNKNSIPSSLVYTTILFLCLVIIVLVTTTPLKQARVL